MTRLRCLALLGAGVLIVACGDPYQHTNPYDPAYPVEFDIIGPDSVFSLGELAHYTVTTSPSFPDSAVTWLVDTFTLHRPGAIDTFYNGEEHTIPNRGDTIVDGAGYFRSATQGTYQSINPPFEPATITLAIDAALGAVDTTVGVDGGAAQTKVFRHVVYKQVVLTQRMVSMQLRCPATNICDTVAVGGTWSVWVDGWDALGHEIVALEDPTYNPVGATPIVTFTSRDSTVASVSPVNIRAATVTALKAGSTWIVATRKNAASDSILVVAQ